jgi:high-affinity nickel-transport protein
MISLLSIIALGFFLGMRHATDPDHVIAVSTIVSRQRKISRSAMIGAFWGVGHTLTILLVGAGIVLFNLVIPPRLGLSMELSVGLMLIILGVMNVVSFFETIATTEEKTAKHAHSHGDILAEEHSHGPDRTALSFFDRTFGRLGLYQNIRPLIVGVVHGLAGSAAVALLVLTTIRNPRWAIAYLLVFGIGTIAGMMLITLSLASTFHVMTRNRRFAQALAMASGLLSLAFGLFVAYQICFVNGLFSGHPIWAPR